MSPTVSGTYGDTFIWIVCPIGETYECDRMSDYGWKLVAEQVSHHPPISAQYCEGKNWKCWQEFSITSKFRGKYIQVSVVFHLIFTIYIN